MTALRVPDLLATAEEAGLGIEKLSADVSIEIRKLCISAGWCLVTNLADFPWDTLGERN